MTDYELYTGKKWLELFERYKPLQMKYFMKISKYIRDMVYEGGFDEFRQDCYIVMMNAINGLKPEKIKNKDTWSFYIQYSQWLHNFTVRDVVKKFCDNYSVSLNSTLEDDEGKELEEVSIQWNDNINNLSELLERLDETDREYAERIMHHLPRGGKGLSEKAVNLLREYYTNY